MASSQLNVLSGPQWPGIQCFSTLRSGGYSQGPWRGLNLGQHCEDNAHHVALNRALLSAQLPSQPHWLQQVHGTELYQATQPLDLALSWEQSPVADAAWTRCPNAVLAILSADCLPVVLSDQHAQILGVAHAGWRGLASGVLARLFKTMQSQLSNASAWQAWIGPAISQKHFEVGPEVYEVFIQREPTLDRHFVFNTSRQKHFADLAAIAGQLLRQLHPTMQVHFSQACTYSQPHDFYSYRRHTPTGRLATLAWLKS